MTIHASFNIDRDTFTLDVDLQLPSRGITAFFGPSGCGKTTLLRAIAGLDNHANGFLKIGDTIWQDGDHFIPPHQRPLGYVFQEANLFPHLTVRRNLEYGRKRTTPAEQKISLSRAVELLGLDRLLDRKPTTLSGGERQRVAMARALAVSPGILLMDEPLAALDHASKQEILPYLESLHDELEIPVLYVSHSLEEVVRLTDHLVLLEAGQVSATGPVNDILTRLDLPLAGDHDAATIIEAVIAGHDKKYHLTYLDTDVGRFTVPCKPLPVGHQVRLRLTARDVSLTLEQQSQTSILNIFPATIEAMQNEKDGQLSVRLLAGDSPILAKITRKAADVLDLQPKNTVFAQVKSVVLLI